MSNPTASTSRPADTTSKPIDITTKSAEATSNPTNITSKAADTTSKPADAATKPTDISTKPAGATSNSADITPKAADATPKPADTTIKSAEATSDPPDNTSWLTEHSVPADSTVLKEWILVRTGRTGLHTEFDIFCDDKLILSSFTDTELSKGRPGSSVNTVEDLNGSVVATCRSRKAGWSKNMDLALKNPRTSTDHGWQKMKSTIFLESKWRFNYRDQSYTWTRTHNKELGSSIWKDRNYKLVEEATGKILAAWVDDGFFLHNRGATISWYVNTDSELELLSLAAILRIGDRIRNYEVDATILSLGVLTPIALMLGIIL